MGLGDTLTLIDGKFPLQKTRAAFNTLDARDDDLQDQIAVLGGGATFAGVQIVVGTLAAAKALPGVQAGTYLRILDQDELFVVSTENVGADGIVTHFFDGDLSAETTDDVAEADFTGDSFASNTGVALSNGKIDLSTVKIVLTDAGEEMPGHYLHGHMMSPGRSTSPQSPRIDIDAGRLYDPDSALRTASTRAAGIGVKYRYNTTGKVLRRVTIPVWKTKWLPTHGAAAGDGVESGNWFCWLLNRAAAGARVIDFDGLVAYNGAIEIPEGMRLRGRSHQDCGLYIPAGHMFDIWLLSRSSVPGTPGTFPLASPNNRKDAFLYATTQYAPGVFPATNSAGHQLENIRIDGDLYNQTEPWDTPADYATANMSTGNWFQDTPVCGGHMSTNHGSRTIPVGQQHEFFGTVELGSFMAAVLLGHVNQRPLINHGRLKLGGSGGNHPIYFQNIVGGVLDFDGGWSGDCFRCYILDVHLDTLKARRHPEPMLVDNAAFTSLLEPARLRTGTGQPRNLIAYSSAAMTEPWLTAAEQALGHGMSARRCKVEGGLIDLTAFGEVPSGATAQVCRLAFLFANDNIDLSDMRIRTGDNVELWRGVFGTFGGNGAQQGPYDHVRIDDILIEVGGRPSNAVQLWADNANNGGTSGVLSLASRNVQVRYLNPVGMMPEYAGPDGVNRVAGIYGFRTVSDTSLNQSSTISFAGKAGSDMASQYFSLNSGHPDAPTVTVWFSVGGVGSAPAGDNPLQVDVASGDAAAAIATKTRAAIVADATANPWYVCKDVGDTVVVGQLRGYREEGRNAFSLAPASASYGTVTTPENPRYFQPHLIEWDRLIVPAPVASGLMQVSHFDADHGPVEFLYRGCHIGAFESTDIHGPAGNGILSSLSAEAAAGIAISFDGCTLAYRTKAPGVSFIHLNAELQLFHARHRGTKWDRGDGTWLYSDRGGTFTFTSTGAEETFDIEDMLFVSPPKAFALTPIDANAAAILAEAAQEWRAEGGAAITTTHSSTNGVETASGNLISPNPLLRVSGFTALANGQTAKFRWSGSLNP